MRCRISIPTLFLLLQIFSITTAVHAQHFTPVDPTGLPWAIVVQSAVVGETSLQEGDEIAVFDGELCVGAKVLDGDWPLAITCWQGDPGFELEGFTTGNPILYRYYITSSDLERTDVTAEYDDNNTVFGSGPLAQVRLSAEEMAVIENTPAQPGNIILSIHPNPCNAGAVINYTLPQPGKTRLDLFDTLGRHRATLDQGVRITGNHSVAWHGNDLPSGIYFIRLCRNDRPIATQKLVLMK